MPDEIPPNLPDQARQDYRHASGWGLVLAFFIALIFALLLALYLLGPRPPPPNPLAFVLCSMSTPRYWPHLTPSGPC